MDIKSISPISLPANTPAAAASKVVSSANASKPDEKKQQNENEKKSGSKLPYVAGTIVLAGLGLYVSRNKIKNILNKKNIEVLEEEISSKTKEFKLPEKIFKRKRKPVIKNEIFPKASETKTTEKIAVNTKAVKNMIPETEVLVPEVIKTAETKKESVIKASQKFDKHVDDIQDVIPESAKIVENAQETLSNVQKNSKVKTVCAGFDEKGAPIYTEIEQFKPEQLASIGDAYQNAKNSLKLNDKVILSKIADTRKNQLADVDRIISENIKDGKLDMPMMHKIARDFASDEAGRGADRYHQAADLLEQSYVTRYIKGDAKQKEGLENFFDIAKTESPLFEIYTKMPMEEAAARLRYLADNDLKSAKYKGMDAERFFEKALDRLVEKLQFKKYNEAHGIKPEF